MPTGTTSCFFPLRYAALRTASSSCSALLVTHPACGSSPSFRVGCFWQQVALPHPTPTQNTHPYVQLTLESGSPFDPEAAPGRLLEWVAKFLTNRFFSCSALSLHFFYLPAGARPHFTGRRKIYGDFPAFWSLTTDGRNGPELPGNRLNQFSAVTQGEPVRHHLSFTLTNLVYTLN